jgi:hypothetical protein
MLEKEFYYYLENQNKLLKKYDGRFVVIIGENVVGDYATFDDAYANSVKQYELGTFLIQKCTEGDKDYTAHIYKSNILLNHIEI